MANQPRLNGRGKPKAQNPGRKQKPKPRNGNIERRDDGTFKRSGNPDGRPKGRKNKITLWQEGIGEKNLKAFVNRVFELAMEGDRTAMRIIAERTSAPMQAESYLPNMDLPQLTSTGAIQESIDKILQAVGHGEIPLEDAERLIRLIGSTAQFLEKDIRDRLDALESRISDRVEAVKRGDFSS